MRRANCNRSRDRRQHDPDQTGDDHLASHPYLQALERSGSRKVRQRCRPHPSASTIAAITELILEELKHRRAICAPERLWVKHEHGPVDARLNVEPTVDLHHASPAI